MNFTELHPCTPHITTYKQTIVIPSTHVLCLHTAGSWHQLGGMTCWNHWWSNLQTVTQHTITNQMVTVVPHCWQSHTSPVSSSSATWLWSTCTLPSSWRTLIRRTKRKRSVSWKMTLRCSTFAGQSKNSGSSQWIRARSILFGLLQIPAELITRSTRVWTGIKFHW